MIIAATGHRPDKIGKNEYDGGPCTDYINEQLDEIIIRYKPNRIISGMALGVDTIWAICGLFHNIQVTAAIPFIGQEKTWPEENQRHYRKILQHKLVIPAYICDPGYASWKMQKRNEWMVDHCNILVAVWDGSSGGTKNCIDYAVKQNKTIIKINPKNYGKFI